eukprot:29518-Lingulodinium_polyedra.AAC.1
MSPCAKVQKCLSATEKMRTRMKPMGARATDNTWARRAPAPIPPTTSAMSCQTQSGRFANHPISSWRAPWRVSALLQMRPSSNDS